MHAERQYGRLKEHAFGLGEPCACAAETPTAIVPISVSTAITAEIRSMRNPPMMKM
jgi:hypothetical protein